MVAPVDRIKTVAQFEVVRPSQDIKVVVVGFRTE